MNAMTSDLKRQYNLMYCMKSAKYPNGFLVGANKASWSKIDEDFDIISEVVLNDGMSRTMIISPKKSKYLQ